MVENGGKKAESIILYVRVLAVSAFVVLASDCSRAGDEKSLQIAILALQQKGQSPRDELVAGLRDAQAALRPGLATQSELPASAAGDSSELTESELQLIGDSYQAMSEMAPNGDGYESHGRPVIGTSDLPVLKKMAHTDLCSAPTRSQVAGQSGQVSAQSAVSLAVYCYNLHQGAVAAANSGNIWAWYYYAYMLITQCAAYY